MTTNPTNAPTERPRDIRGLPGMTPRLASAPQRERRPADRLRTPGGPVEAVVRLAASPRGSGAEASAEPRRRNRLLRSLPSEEYERLLPFLVTIEVETRTLLFDDGGPITHVYFPESAVASLVLRLRDGGAVEVGTTGFEGMVGIGLFLGDATATVRAFTQVPGTMQRMGAADFLRLSGPGTALHQAVLRYTHAFLLQVTQTAACNAAHLVRERCARWLLLTHDRVDGDQFPLTHDFLAVMLGVRRAGVTVAMQALQDAGLLRYTRGRVSILDRAGLEAASCECYEDVRGHFERLFPNAG